MNHAGGSTRSPIRRSIDFGLLAVLAATALLSGSDRAEAAGSYNTISILDEPVLGGSYLVVDNQGYPVIASYDMDQRTLKVVHCNDPYCSGGDESMSVVGADLACSALVLDPDGNPMTACRESHSTDLAVVHCNDPLCVGSDEAIAFPDPGATLSPLSASLAIDGDGLPVVSYVDEINYDLWILRCNDANCTGGDETITRVDSGGFLGWYTSLAIDASGHPVVAYHDLFNGVMKVLHCNDPVCAGSDDSITVPDTDSAGHYSLQLDDLGNPVVSFSASGLDGLKVLHCNDPLCAGGDESITIPDPAQDAILATALILAPDGNPLVAYRDGVKDANKVLRCNDANCAGGDDYSFVVDVPGTYEFQPSIAIGSDGFPLVAYSAGFPHFDLRLLRCGMLSCNPDTDGDGCNDPYELIVAPGSEGEGGKRSPKNPYDFYDVNGDGVVDSFYDIMGTASLFGADSDTTGFGEPDGYDPAFDRSAPLPGDDPWDMQAPDGLIDLFTDIFGAAFQFGHTCA